MTLRWRELDSNLWYRIHKSPGFSGSIPGIAVYGQATTLRAMAGGDDPKSGFLDQNAALRRLQITRVIIAHALKRSPLPSGCCGSKAPRALQRNSRTAAAGRRHS